MPMLSQWAKFQRSLFRIGTFLFTRNGVALGPQWWPRWQFHRWPSQGHLRSSKLTNHFWRITFDSEEIETWEWSHCVSLINTHRFICIMPYLGQNVTLTRCQILTLTFQGQVVHASWQGKHDGVKIIALSFQTQKLSSENGFAQKWRFLLFVTSDA